MRPLPAISPCRSTKTRSSRSSCRRATPTATTLTFSIVTPPAHGTLTGTLPNVTYTPAANYNGPDSFTFRASDGSLVSNTATVSITVAPVNDAPVALAARHYAAQHRAHAGRRARRTWTATP